MRSSIRLRVVDVVAITLVAGFFATVAVAVVQKDRETENRITCAAHLRQIGTAMGFYADENRGAFPRTVAADLNWTPTWGTPYAADAKLAATPGADPFADAKKAPKEVVAVKPAGNDVTAALFLLLRTEDLTPDVFTCPSAGTTAWDYGGAKPNGAQQWTNFPGKAALAAHLSFSFQNPYSSADAIAAGFHWNKFLWKDFPVLADMNPGTPEVVSVTPTSPADVLRKANSLNHAGVGQNVLFADSHVEFRLNIFAGKDKDNIYTANGAETGRKKARPEVVVSPADAFDTILLPTAEAIGQVPVTAAGPAK